LTESIFKLKETKNKLEKYLANNYPEYYKAKYKNDVITVKEVQNMLVKDQTLLEYFVGKENVFVFKIEVEKYNVKIIKKDFALIDLVQNIRNGIYNYWITPLGKRTESMYDSLSQLYVDNASSLYSKIIEPIGNISNNLIIVPDDILGYIPFETLLITKPIAANNFKSHHYLGNQHYIYYNYSSTLWHEMLNKKHENKGLIAIAPVFQNSTFTNSKYRSNNLSPLSWNIPEVKRINSIIGGDLLIGKNATKEKFESISNNYSIIHLATHAKLNDLNSSYSYLAFTNFDDTNDKGKIYVSDLYNYHLPLDMVVLSACETGIGKLERGEGIISLTRGFALAGAKSIINSLWEVNDKATSDIMTEFYKNLKSGLPKQIALHDAKQTYLNNQIENRTAHPFFWASFIPIGDMNSIHFAHKIKYYWILIIFVTILALFYFRHYLRSAHRIHEYYDK